MEEPIIATPMRRRRPKALPSNIGCVQPGGGPVVRLEMAWGRVRRWLLRTFRPGYVARMGRARLGDCPECTHEIIDPRDLKLVRNVCGYWFRPADVRLPWLDRFPVAHWGSAELLLLGGALVGVTAFAGWWSAWAWIPPACAALFVVAFFRDPRRRIPDEQGAVVAPADGTVTDVEVLTSNELLGGPAIKIGIYLSVFNVHINRCPAAARVIELQYHPGRFRDVRDADAPTENEQMWTLLECEDAPHHLLAVKQIAGAFARRIVCAVRPGEVLSRGAKIGMIKFGSRTELLLSPADGLVVAVKAGDRVRGGSSILARYAMTIQCGTAHNKRAIESETADVRLCSAPQWEYGQ